VKVSVEAANMAVMCAARHFQGRPSLLCMLGSTLERNLSHAECVAGLLPKKDQ